MLQVHTLTYNPWQENTYIISAENGECIIIDPGCLDQHEQDHLVKYMEEKNFKPVRILNTHLHLDHVFGNQFVCNKFNLRPEAHHGDEFWIEQTVPYAAQMGIQLNEKPPALKAYLTHGQEIEFGGSMIKVLHIPGHSPGSVVFYCEKEGFVIVGDVLFKESIGRADLPGGDFSTLITGIKENLMTLPDEVKVYSGHGPQTSIGYERTHNMFF
jgi:glyoxylase-like metal-dependent hydrolase (beta-lactamase superfamily II)